MDHLKVLKRALEVTWRYRALWIFGVILALTTADGAGTRGLQYVQWREDLPPRLGAYPFLRAIPPEGVVAALVAIGVGLACLIVVMIVAAAVARYVAETALIRMVDDHEGTGERPSIRQGFRTGWSRTAFRLFLIDLLITFPLALLFILLFLLALTPLLLWATDSEAAGVVGTIAAVGLFLLVLLLVIVVAAVAALLMRFFRRACALDKVGVIESIRQGFGVVRDNLKDVAIMWAIMIGLGVVWAIVMIPVAILLLLAGVALGGLPALLVGGLASLIFGVVPWVVAGAVGIPIFILVVAVPGLFLAGLGEVFQSTVWTLTYRELSPRERLAMVDVPVGPEQVPG